MPIDEKTEEELAALVPNSPQWISYLFESGNERQALIVNSLVEGKGGRIDFCTICGEDDGKVSSSSFKFSQLPLAIRLCVVCLRAQVAMREVDGDDATYVSVKGSLERPSTN
jgi:hypothetical protein